MRKISLAALSAWALLTLQSATAHADGTIGRPGEHPSYAVELEPHGAFGWGASYGGDGGFGAGLRFAIPIVRNGFIPSINNSVAIAFDLDWVHYGYCWFAPTGCNADYLDFSATLQWNFYVAQRWTVFGEPGVYAYHGLFGQPSCPPSDFACQNAPAQWGVLPAFYAGGRYHFSDKVALTLRAGFPTTSVGVSFFF